ncbi:DUF1688 domain protein [Polychaeton citri CBS 116435]|uniref:DUF1688 domain protein n=1 Tax=Polychaeton citri CBS 116435 TaxID=1314669 RepID=A0A9P4QAA9_9PEZI|nr:DUF1688 domain protein [Polychaeton citri CBS 116435]
MDADISYLLSLEAVRQRARCVLEAAENGGLSHFDYHRDNLESAADIVERTIVRDFGPDKFHEIPPHGRWQHFDVGGVDRIAKLLADLGPADSMEKTRCLIDLFFVSVLLDAGAGDTWRFKEPVYEQSYGRSEGIAVASFYMFTSGVLSSEAGTATRVDGLSLSKLEDAQLLSMFQISSDNTMIGVESRAQLLRDVGKSLLRLPEIFGVNGRPGNLADYLTQSSADPQFIDYKDLWSALQKLLIPSWPLNRTHIHGQPLGDAWPLKVLERQASKDGSSDISATIQPFHKLTQWLAYSLSVPFVRVLGLEWKNIDLGTGLAEYRNGGLFVDTGVLSLKDWDSSTETGLPKFDASSDVIVEWRAMTVALLDRLHEILSQRFASKGVKLDMAQMLEAGSWKTGRELAAEHRPETRSSPIIITGDGTLF